MEETCRYCGYPHASIIRRWEFNPKQVLIECPNCGESMTVPNKSYQEGYGCKRGGVGTSA